MSGKRTRRSSSSWRRGVLTKPEILERIKKLQRETKVDA
jgi:hypothetical protein